MNDNIKFLILPDYDTDINLFIQSIKRYFSNYEIIDYYSIYESKEFGLDQLFDSISEIFKNKKYENINIVGFGFGGVIATYLEKKFSTNIKNIILVNPYICVGYVNPFTKSESTYKYNKIQYFKYLKENNFKILKKYHNNINDKNFLSDLKDKIKESDKLQNFKGLISDFNFIKSQINYQKDINNNILCILWKQSQKIEYKKISKFMSKNNHNCISYSFDQGSHLMIDGDFSEFNFIFKRYILNISN